MFVKILVLAVVGVMLTVILRKYCRELVPIFEIALVAGAFVIIADAEVVKRSGIEKIFSVYSGSSEIFTAILKGAAVTVLTRLACDVCRESGNSLVADIVELGGRIMLVVLAIPFLEKVTEIALSFYG